MKKSLFSRVVNLLVLISLVSYYIPHANANPAIIEMPNIPPCIFLKERQPSFSLENTGAEEIEIVTAQSNGKSVSSEVLFYLQDKDGNVLSSIPLKQSVGAMLTTLSDGKSVARIPAGAVWTSDNMEITVPANAPSQVYVKSAVNKVHYHSGRADHVEMQGISTTKEIALADTAYYGEIVEITPKESVNTNNGKDQNGIPEITIKGKAVNRTDKTALKFVPLKLVIAIKGFERTFDIITGEDGTFTQMFKPLGGESGIYTVYLVHPALLDRKPLGTFTIKRAVISPEGFNIKAPRNYEQSLNVTLTTCDGTTVNNARLVFDPADQESYDPSHSGLSGILPEGIYLTLPNTIPSIAPNQSANLSFKIRADNKAPASGTIKLRVLTDNTPSFNFQPLTLNFAFSEAKPALYFTPNYIETGMGRGDSVTEVVTLQNKGLSEMLDLELTLVNQDGTPAPSWIQLNSEAYIESLDVGASYPVNIAFNPGNEVTEGYHNFYLRIKSANYAQTDIGIYAAVTQSGKGGILFKCQDIYTGTLDANNQIIQGLTGASIELQHETITTIKFTGVTDSVGEKEFQNVPAGVYKAKISANEHQGWIGRVFIKPGITAIQEAFLDYNLVTVEWSVNPITIEDKYEIILNATFKTDVPAPVVVMEPGSVTLPEMHKGDIFNGEIKMTNYGLIQAEAVKLTMPPEDAFFKYEILATVPEILNAKQSLVIPYRVTCLLSPNLDDPVSTGGGCERKGAKLQATYHSITFCGKIIGGYTEYNWVYEQGNCTTAPAPSKVAPPVAQPGGMQWSESYGGGGSVSQSPTMSIAIEMPDICFVCILNRLEDWYRKAKKIYKMVEKKLSEVGCSINEVTRDFEEDLVDLTVKVPGGAIELRRRFYGKNWSFDLIRKPLYFMNLYRMLTGSGDGKMKAIMPEKSDQIHGGGCRKKDYGLTLVKREVPYYPDPNSNNVYIHDTYIIKWIPETTVWRWEAKEGDWEEYDRHGNFLRYGNRTGIIGELIYKVETTETKLPLIPRTKEEWGDSLEDPYKDYKPESWFTSILGVKDRNGNQVLWFEYDEDKQLSAVQDSAGRRVEYSYYKPIEGIAYVLPSGNHNMSHEVAYYDPFFKRRPIRGYKDISGNITTYETSKTKMVITNPENHVTTVNFDVQGGVTSVLDENNMGHRTSWNYNSTTKIQSACITSTSGKTEEMWYDKCGDTIKYNLNGVTQFKVDKIDARTVLETDEAGRVIKKECDEWKNVTRIVYPDNTEIKIDYEPQYHQPIQIIDRMGIVTKLEYDHQGNLTKKIEAAGTSEERTSSYTYNDQGNVLTASVGGAVYTMTYDSCGNLATVSDPLGNKSEFLDFDNMGNFRTMKNPLGQVFTFGYDNLGRLISKKDSLNNETKFEYNKVNDLSSLTNAYGKTFTFEYDGYHNPIKVKDPLNGIVNTTYDQNGAPVKIEDQNNVIIKNVFDPLGKITQNTDGANNNTSYVYNDGSSKGYTSQVKEIQYPTYKTTYEYDDEGRVKKETNIADALSVTTSYEYNINGNVISATDTENRKTRFEYDSLGRLKKTIDSQSNETEQKYDERGNLKKIIDSNGGEITFEYDLANRLTKLIRPEGQETSYKYNALGQVVKILDSKGQVIVYEYTELGKLKTAKYFESTVDANPLKTVSFEYNKVGNLTGYDDGTTSAVYSYDDLQRKIGETVDYGTFSLSYSYEYYPNGLKKSFTNANGDKVEYTYDNNNRLSVIKLPNGNDITWNTFKWNSPTQMTFPGGSKKNFNYDGFMRVDNLNTKDPGQNTIMDFSYTRDKSGNILSKTVGAGLVPAQYSYTYDNLSRLKTAVNPNAPNEAYNYDSLGNRLSMSFSSEGESFPLVGNPSSLNLTYNKNNEITSFDIPEFSVSYDSNGNITRKVWNGAVQNYYYDIENRLSKVEDDAGKLIASFYYDPFGRRLWKTCHSEGVQATEESKTYFFYSDEGLVTEFSSSTEISDFASQIPEGTKTYGYSPNSQWSTNPLWLKCHSSVISNEVRNLEYFFYHTDSQGTPCKLTDSTGLVVWDATYDSFGNCTILKEDITNNFRFAGQYADIETGLYYNWQRYYDPKLGRYTQTDPEGEGLNLYSYVFNNPNGFIDPTGTHKIANAYESLMNAFGILSEILGSGLYEILYNDFYGIGSALSCLSNVIGGGAYEFYSAIKGPLSSFLKGADFANKILAGLSIGAIAFGGPFGVGIGLQGLAISGYAGAGIEAGKLFTGDSSFKQAFTNGFISAALGYTGTKLANTFGSLAQIRINFGNNQIQFFSQSLNRFVTNSSAVTGAQIYAGANAADLTYQSLNNNN